MNWIPSPPPNQGQILPDGTFDPIENGGYSRSNSFQERKLNLQIPLRWDFDITLAPDVVGVAVTQRPLVIQQQQRSGPSISITAEEKFKVVLTPATQVIAGWPPDSPPFNSFASLGPVASSDKCPWASENELLINNFDWVKNVRDFGQYWHSFEAKRRVQKWLDDWFIVKWVRFARDSTELVLYGDLIALDKYGNVLGSWSNYANQEAAVAATLSVNFKLILLCHELCNYTYLQEGSIGYFYRQRPDSEEAINWSIDENGYWEEQ